MGIFRTNDPTQFDDVDQIVIDESAPPGQIRGVPANIAILVGQFQRGPVGVIREVGSSGELFEQYGDSNYQGNLELKNKKFSRLRLIRVLPSGSAPATLTVDDGVTTDILQFDAKQGNGLYGNSIKITIDAGTTAGKKYTIQDTSTNAVLPTEIFDNVETTGKAQADIDQSFKESKLVDVTLLDNSAEPATLAETAMAGGSDGTAVDTDYEDAIQVAEVEGSGNVLFLDEYNTLRNGYLKTHAANTQDKMVIVAGPEVQTVAQALTDADLNRDGDGRIIYAYPWVENTINGVSTFSSPASWYASILSQTAPNIDPAYSANTQFLGGMTDLKLLLSRSQYIQLKDAGVSAFEFDSDVGFKVKTGAVTQIVDSAKTQVLRRRMADFLTNSIAKALKPFQNGVNSQAERNEVKGIILDFITRQENDGVLPKDSEVKGGGAKLVDTDSLNTDAVIALGFFKILYRQRIYSSMRFIVLQAEIGESVVVTEV